MLDVASALSPLSTVLVLGFDVSDCEGFVLAGKGSESSYGNCVRRYEDSFSLMILLCFADLEVLFVSVGDADLMLASGDEADMVSVEAEDAMVEDCSLAQVVWMVMQDGVI